MNQLQKFQSDLNINLVELREAIDAVPFGQSIYQNTHLADDSATPERRLRHVLLQLNQRLNTLKQCEFRRRKLEVDMDEIRSQLPRLRGFAKRRALISLEEIEWGLQQEVKLINDAIIEVETFYQVYKTLPKITREQFEAAEPGYWRERLTQEARREILAMGTVTPGTLAALHQIGLTILRDKDDVNKVEVLPKPE